VSNIEVTINEVLKNIGSSGPDELVVGRSISGGVGGSYELARKEGDNRKGKWIVRNGTGGSALVDAEVAQALIARGATEHPGLMKP
jgi:hypothetical protein